MEYSFASKEQGNILWDSLSPQSGAVPEDPSNNNNNNISELMNFDAYAGWCSTPPSSTDQMLAYTYAYSPIQSFSTSYSPFDSFNFPEQNPPSYSMPGGDTSNNNNTTTTTTTTNNNNNNYNDNTEMEASFIPRALSQTLPERMLKALSLFKESSGGAILAQVWVPVKQGDQILLSTCEQPYLLDQMLAGYREISRAFTFSAEVKPGTFPGLPGRVYISKVPEWTSNVGYYKKPEYLRLQHAAAHEVRGSIALPIFEDGSDGVSCCAVLELVTMREKPHFDLEIENVCRALQAVDLRSIAPPRLHFQSLTNHQRAALAEITDVLRAVCHAHTLPLALTWIPCCYDNEVDDENNHVRVRGGNASLKEKCILCVEDTACYVNNAEMQGFVHACTEHYLEEGQGVAGKALKSNHPFFFPDVKAYDISEYPLVHHARKYCLHAAVAIRLRSTYTGNDDYILEFFLPINMKGGTEQQLLLDNLSGTMQRICKSLRRVSDAELINAENSGNDFQNASVSDFQPVSYGRRESQLVSESNCNDDQMTSDICKTPRGGSKSVGPHEKMRVSRVPAEKKKSTAEKHVSLAVLQQYFSGSLKEAAKSIGVCPTTLKRICRQHGISRWPSRKINKVNRSLQKIQTVLDSVQGVEGGLKFDPISGGLVAATGVVGGSINKDFNDMGLRKNSSDHLFPSKNPSFIANNTTDLETQNTSFYPISSSLNHGQSSMIKLEEEFEPFHSENKSYFEHRGEKNSGQVKSENSDSHFVSNSSSSIDVAAADDYDEKMDDRIDGQDDSKMEHDNHPVSSGMTDSSKGSGNSILHENNSSSSRSTNGKTKSKFQKRSVEKVSKISVKATYKEDTIRFKFDPGEGCPRLYEEVAKRFNLQTGTFHLKYLDDEEEWVMLVSDSDLQECIEILEYVGTSCVKFLVRDVPFGMGSSGSSNNFLSCGL